MGLPLDDNDVFLLMGAGLVVESPIALSKAPGQWVNPAVIGGRGEVGPWTGRRGRRGKGLSLEVVSVDGVGVIR